MPKFARRAKLTNSTGGTRGIPKTDPELAVLLVVGLPKQKLAFQEKEPRLPAELGS